MEIFNPECGQKQAGLTTLSPFFVPVYIEFPLISGTMILVSEKGIFVDGINNSRKFLHPQAISLAPLFGLWSPL